MANSTNTTDSESCKDASVDSKTLTCSLALDASRNDHKNIQQTPSIACGGSMYPKSTVSTDDRASRNDSILSAYRRLSSRKVDLIGDYTGNEPFLIDGDSLLLHCFNDKCLDLQDGLQLLHAVYAVENFLAHLKRRKCVFRIVFFDANRQLCIPPGVSDGLDARYLLAREVIVRHLQAHLSSVDSRLSISRFNNHREACFLSFLGEHSPYFLMLHDRAFEQSMPTTAQDKAQQAVQREFILDFVQQGFNVALINELTWRDSKVITVVLESTQPGRSFDAYRIPAAKSTGLSKFDVVNPRDKMDVLKRDFPTLSERQILLVLTVGRLFRAPRNPSFPNLRELVTALLLHQVMLFYMPLSDRRIANCSADRSTRRFLSHAAATSAEIMLQGWRYKLWDTTDICDIGDFIDGRLFYKIYQGEVHINDLLEQELKVVCDAVHRLYGAVGILALPKSSTHYRASNIERLDAIMDFKVLPFSNAIFDAHLSPIILQTESDGAEKLSIASQKIFKELSYRRNPSRLVHQGATVVKNYPYKGQRASRYSQFWIRAQRASRRSQFWMTEIRHYAASLTNAVGMSLEPELVVVASNDAITVTSNNHDAIDKTKTESQKAKYKGGAKAAKKNANKKALLAKAVAEKMRKTDATNEKILMAWRGKCRELDDIENPLLRYRKAQTGFLRLQSSWRAVINVHHELYMLECLLEAWSSVCKNGQRHHNMHIPALIWYHVRCADQMKDSPSVVMHRIKAIMATVSIPTLLHASEGSIREYKSNPGRTRVDLSVNMEPASFQLVHCGPFLERSFNAKSDARVPFKPDEWQSDVLDCIDADKSVFVVAPPSAGKTFISFYAMHKILRADDDGVLVYVAPTKALVNQIAAEIQARYVKKYKYGCKTVWAVDTGDYRINDPTGCQILVTVPAILQTMLLSPSNANSWSSRVRRIIFDEVHSIGNTEEGVVWEQLLLMAPCPIIALSATVGNPHEFGEWLESTQKAMNNELVTIQHLHRYSDLRKYFYTSPKKFKFMGVPEDTHLAGLGLDDLPGFNYIHPVITIDRTRGIPKDLALESRDCYYLWEAMQKVKTQEYPVPPELAPQFALSSIVGKVDVLSWEANLKMLLQRWLEKPDSPYDRLIKVLGEAFYDRKQEAIYQTHQEGGDSSGFGYSPNKAAGSTLALLCRLQERDALPAILFNYDRRQCEVICKTVCDQLKAAEIAQKKSGPNWRKTLERWEEYKEQLEKISEINQDKQDKQKNKQNKHILNKQCKKQKVQEDSDEKLSKSDRETEKLQNNQEPQWASFDPEAPMDGYHFADYTKVQASELLRYTEALHFRGVRPFLIDALGRGIAVHHAGLNLKYRQTVEILFRKRFLRVIVATETLALGINMPCKTSVFVSDSVYLTALNYRQCAGRAGRRGFDLLGNVVFHGISEQKVFRLLSSRLPDLNGHFPLTTTLVLRLFHLLHESKSSQYAVKAINALLSQPRLCLGGDGFKEQTLHHLRFSIEYLRRQSLLGVDGAPLNFAGLVTHLYYTENSSFAFHALLKEGYFHNLCAEIDERESHILETLMLIMAHLFKRTQLRRLDLEYREEMMESSSSLIFLPLLPEEAARVLSDHNEQTLQVYKTYVKTFIEQHVGFSDDKLPLTGVSFGSNKHEGAIKPYDSPTSIRSSYVALSGASDHFESIYDLCSTTRSGVCLDEAVIPYLPVASDDEAPLNAWLLDFYRHGDIMKLVRANGIGPSVVWSELHKFSLILATIVTSLSDSIKLTETDDLDMLDVQSSMDKLENAKEATLLAPMDDSKNVMTSVAKDHAAPRKINARKADVAESWDDENEEDNIDNSGVGTSSKVSLGMHDNVVGFGASLKEGNGSLVNVLKSFQKLQIEFNEKFKAIR